MYPISPFWGGRGGILGGFGGVLGGSGRKSVLCILLSFWEMAILGGFRDIRIVKGIRRPFFGVFCHFWGGRGGRGGMGGI